jgi:RNA polymerase sigma-70 factor (ECF subfamily)
MPADRVETGKTVPGPEGDLALIDQISRGDRQALATLYDRYAPILLAVGQRILGERRESEDLLHDVFLEAWRAIRDYDPARGTVRAWLCLRMRSRALDRLRSAGRARVVSMDEVALPESDAMPGDDPTLGPDRVRVRAALSMLPNEQRAVLELAYFEGLSSSEIAERLTIPVGTVKSRVAAAMSKLRTGLNVEEGGPR